MAKKADTLPSYMTNTTTVQPFMPGWDNSLARQMAAGGFGSEPSLLAYMNQFYSPMQLPGGAAPAAPTPAPNATPNATPAPSTGGRWNGHGNGHGNELGSIFDRIRRR